MQWVIFLLPLLFAVCSGFTKSVTEASESEVADAGAKKNVAIEESDSLTQAKVSSTIVSDSSIKTSTSGPGATIEANVDGTVSQKSNPPRVIPGNKVDSLQNASDPTTSSTTKTPMKTTTSPPIKECDPCKQPDFMGFGFNPGKCGCCPWPCCCKCVATSGGPVASCRALLDLAFIMDDSGSIGTTDWVVAKQFFKDVVSELTSIGTDQFVSSITYSTNASLNWNLNDPETANKATLSSSIIALEQSKLLTNPAEAMELAVNEVFVDGIDNPNAANVAVLMTDGRANFRIPEIAGIANQLRAKATTICVGITTKTDKAELLKICDEDNIFDVVDFNSLQNILESLQTKICPTPPVTEKCFCCCTPEQFWANGGASYYRRRW